MGQVVTDDKEKQLVRQMPNKAEQVDGHVDPLQLEMFGKLLDLEQKRINTTNRRTEVAMRAVEASDAADQRQYDYHIKKLESDDSLERVRLSLGAKGAFGVGGSIILLLSLVLYMMFFGTETQASQARELLTWGFTALGGGGLLFIAQRGVRWLMKLRHD